jgi:hypothetical protein
VNAGFDLESWNKAVVFKGRLATDADVTEGRAIFSLKDTENGRPLEMELPQPVIWYEDDDEFGALVVQAEAHETEDGETLEVLGLLLPNGDEVIAFTDDVDEVDATDPFWVALVEAYVDDDEEPLQ